MPNIEAPFIRRSVRLIRAVAERLTARRRKATRFRRALSVVGTLSSGRTDISVEHDRELDEIYGS